MSSLSGSADAKVLLDAVRRAGVVGQGGAGFPTHVKFETRAGTVIANGCECEPLLYTDQHLMCAHAGQIVRALCAVMAAVGASRGVVALKSKHVEAARALTGPAAAAGVELVLLGDFYPAGDEHILVHEITGRTIPPLGLPREVDALVSNVGTLVSVSQALDGLPVIRKTLTVTGEVARPGVIEAPLGTSLAECLDFCGGSGIPDPVFLVGGPMMGRFLENRAALEQAVVTKTTGGLIALPRDSFLHQAATLSPQVMRRRAATACIQCRFCTDLCPRYLVGHGFETHRAMRAFAAGADAGPETEQALLCSECGLCEMFSCPMGLSPRRINALLKARFRELGQRHQGPREVHPEQSDLRPFRKVPTARLAARIGIGAYLGIHPEFLGACSPKRVRIPLSQHIGAPALAKVSVGTQVEPGDLIGECPEGSLGAHVHASIRGVVVETGTFVVIEGA
ncbi:MAG: propanediol utilization protein [Deltaproteobacteria bacterium HGW-Deltaproteobacteria-8]|jgi:Na+-translocating ferredoxin:NAD+ oxidoreductase RnfC subunit|nr:MAG: propanediol utilization protein [Deltaproteobacteria bacterium HGW-Deltaproteobacteria-8]